MAVEQSQSLHDRRDVHFNFLEPFHQYYVFQNACRRLAIYVCKFETVPVKMNRVSVIGLVIEDQTIAATFVEEPGLSVTVIAFAVDGPTVEASRSAVDLPESYRTHLFRARTP